jgi:Zn-dependent peptidase ImmA (M78 family)
MYKTRIPKKIRSFAINNIGVEIRVAESLEQAKIIGLPEEANKHEALYIQKSGVIFIKKYTKFESMDLNFILLHELGHAILDFYKNDAGLKIEERDEEIKANGIAFAIAALLKIPISETMIKNLNRLLEIKDDTKIYWEI